VHSIVKSSAVVEMGDGDHNRHEPKRGGGCCAPFAGRELIPRLTQCGLGRGLLPYQAASSSIQPFVHSRHGPKIGGCVSLFGGSVGQKLGALLPFGEGELGPHLTQESHGPRSTSVQSGILIHSAIWPQQIWADNCVGDVPLLGRDSWVLI